MGSLLGGKTKSTTTQNQTWGPTQYVADAYKGLINQAQGVAKTPYNPATAQKVAGFTAPQYQGFAGVQNNQGAYQPYMDQAAGLATLGSSAITGDQIAGYMNPYTDQVIDASMNDWQRMAQRRMTDTNSNASKIGALTGDRSQVAQALAREASDNEMASGIANLRNQGWQSALGAAQTDASRALQGAQIEGSLGGLAQQYGYNDAEALLNIGKTQQDQQQKVLDANTLNAKTRSAYPFETTQWLANILQGIGSQAGGESTGTGTTTQKSGGGLLGKILGVGSMLFGAPGMANGGVVDGPENRSYVPVSSLHAGNPLQPPQIAPPQVSSGQSSGGMADLLESFKQAKSALNSDSGGGLGSLLRTSTDPASGWSTTVNPSSTSGWGNYLSSGLSGLASGLSGMFGFANGGMVPAYADGGEVYDPFVQFGPTSTEAPQRPAQAGLAPLAASTPAASVPASEPKRKGWGSLWGNGLSDDANQAIFMAGLGMLGGGGRDAFEDIGRGGLMGLQFYNQSKQQKQADAQGKLMEINGKLVRVMPDGTTQVVYDGGTADQGKLMEVNGKVIRAMPNGTVSVVYDSGPKAGEQTAADRERLAVQYGIDPASDVGKFFILTGKLPREDQQSLTATDKKAILEADEMAQVNEAAIKALDEAKKLSPQANQGWFAGARASLSNNLPDLLVPDIVSSKSSGEATTNLDNAVIGTALAQLKSVFGGNPTEGERKILLELQGSSSQPDAVRQDIYQRAIEMAKKRLEFNKQRAAELRGGTYYKPGAGAPAPQQSNGGDQKADPLGIR